MGKLMLGLIVLLIIAGVIGGRDRGRQADAKQRERLAAYDACGPSKECRERVRQKYTAEIDKDMTDTIVTDARFEVWKALRDPNSASWGPVFVSYKNGTAVCGTVNAKNAFGGYTGMQTFVVLNRTGNISMGDAKMWKKHCDIVGRK